MVSSLRLWLRERPQGHYVLAATALGKIEKTASICLFEEIWERVVMGEETVWLSTDEDRRDLAR